MNMLRGLLTVLFAGLFFLSAWGQTSSQSSGPVKSSSAPASQSKPAAPAAAQKGAKPQAAVKSVVEKKTVNMSVNLKAIAGTTPLVLAKELGYWRDEGFQDIKITFGGGGADALTMLASGDVDVALISTSDIIVAAARPGLDLITVYPINLGIAFQAVVRSDVAKERGITPDLPLKDKLARLKGLTFGTTSKAGAFYTRTIDLLDRFGFDAEKHMDAVFMGTPANYLAAFGQGKVQVVTASADTLVLFYKNNQAMMLVDFADIPTGIFPPIPHTSVVLTKSFAAKNPNTVQGLVRALVRAFHALRQDPKKAAELVYPEFKQVDRETFFGGLFQSQALVTAIPDGYRMSKQEWDHVVEYAVRSRIVTKDQASKIDTSEGVLWTNKFIPK